MGMACKSGIESVLLPIVLSIVMSRDCHSVTKTVTTATSSLWSCISWIVEA